MFLIRIILKIEWLLYNMDVFILSKVVEMNETEKESFVFELLYNTYKILKTWKTKFVKN